MVSAPLSPRPSKFRATLNYFDKYDYPLTKSELIYWFSPGEIGPVAKSGDFYHLPGREKIVQLRLERENVSRKKWEIAKTIANKLKKFPTIEAIFITGALAMNNSPLDDDIDFMIVTSPNSLWATRFFVDIYLILLGVRRPSMLSEHSSPRVANKICDNIWLESSHLRVTRQNLYTAHEVLQAKIAWGKEGVYQKWLSENSWVVQYLPNAGEIKNKPNLQKKTSIMALIFWPINVMFFVFQYLYMRSKITSERVSLHQGWFHPELRQKRF